MRTFDLVEPASRSRTEAPAPWVSLAWSADSRIKDWSEMERDWAGAARGSAVDLPEQRPLDEDEPMTMLMLGCLVLCAVLSGVLVFSLMRTFIG